MSGRIEALASVVLARLGESARRRPALVGELSIDVPAATLVAALAMLRDDPELRFEMLIDVAGVDYLDYGRSEWKTTAAGNSGFGRGVNRAGQGGSHEGRRFACVYQLLSVSRNERLTVRAFCDDDAEPALPSVVGVYASANWFEREAFDLFGILFHGHPDLRRILTDYGFIGHPFRKDFPLAGNVEVRYDEAKGRVVYEPVEITPRTLVPRVIRDDNRYAAALKDRPANG
ncbi:MAG: hypothetical protein RL026_2728 [Pseudomonadota bacterium]|jgi:NADH-quinone oxidoreductase subunit C